MVKNGTKDAAGAATGESSRQKNPPDSGSGSSSPRRPPTTGALGVRSFLPPARLSTPGTMQAITSARLAPVGEAPVDARVDAPGAHPRLRVLAPSEAVPRPLAPHARQRLRRGGLGSGLVPRAHLWPRSRSRAFHPPFCSQRPPPWRPLLAGLSRPRPGDSAASGYLRARPPSRARGPRAPVIGSVSFHLIARGSTGPPRALGIPVWPGPLRVSARGGRSCPEPRCDGVRPGAARDYPHVLAVHAAPASRSSSAAWWRGRVP